MHHLVKKHTISFKNAFVGLSWAIKYNPNYRVHLLLSLVPILAGFFLKISYFEWLVIVLLIVLGLIFETINAAIEVATDAIDKQWREDLKIAKDVSAAAVLIFSIGALIMAGIIFLPKFISLLTFNF